MTEDKSPLSSLLDITPDKSEAVLNHPAVVFLPRQVEVLPGIRVVVVELQPHHLLQVVPGAAGHVPAQPSCAPPAGLPPALSPSDAVTHVPEGREGELTWGS